MCGSRGGTGGPDPPEKSQKYRVVWIPRKITKLLSEHSVLCHNRHASGTPFDFSGIWIHSLNKQSWTPLKKTFWIRAYLMVQSINFGVPKNIVFLSLKLNFAEANSRDPDEVPRYAALH